MIVKIKKLHVNAVIPKHATDGSVGLDLTAVSKEYSLDQVSYGTGLAVEIPKGHVGLLFPRSSVYKYDLSLSNSVGVIDSDYRGEIKLKFNLLNGGSHSYDEGDRVGQLIILPYPNISLIESDELSETIRGTNGYGSSGK